MREAAGLEHGGKGEPAWRGRPEGTEAPAHGWQQAPDAAEHASPGFWRRVRVPLLIALFAGLMAWFVISVSFAPLQTPLVAVEAARYEWPFPPNAWAQEDLDSLSALHGQNLSVTELAVERQTSAEVLRGLDAQLTAAGGRVPLPCIVIYVSMLGTIDGSGNPCLIPPGTSPLESERWLPVAQLLQCIGRHRELDGCNKLLVFDSNRSEVDWQLCMLYNGFAEQLAGAVEAAGVPKLAVINSAAGGEIGWSSPELGASIFSHYLRLGLAGLADTQSGNGDRRVDLRELHRYLADRVDAWAVANRAAHQRPMLLPSGSEDFPVTWSLNRRTQQRLLAQPASPGRPAVTADELGKLWRKRDQFARLAPYQADPLAWRDFQQRLLWLEQAAASGRAYSTSARNVYADLVSLAATIDRRISADSRSRPSRPVNLFRERPPLRLAAHSLPFADYLGQPDGAQLENRLASVDHVAGPAALAQLVANFEPVENGHLLVERQFLRLLARYDLSALLKPPALLGRAMEVRELAERAALPGDRRALAAIKPGVAKADELRRQAEDRWLSALAPDRSQAVSSWTAAASAYKLAHELNADLLRAWSLADRAWAELPYTAAWLCRPLSLGQSGKRQDERIAQMLLPLVERTRSLAALLVDFNSDDPSRQVLARQAAEVTDGLNRLDAFVASEAQRLLGPDEPAASTVQEIRAMLRMPLLPAPTRDQLLKRLGTLSTNLQAGFAGKQRPEEPKPPSAAEPPEAYARRASRWPLHPALALLNADRAPGPGDVDVGSTGPAGGNADPVAGLATASQALRSRLLELPVDIRRQLSEKDEGEAKASHTGLQPLALRVRAGSGFWFPALRPDPVERLAQQNLQLLLLWQASRVLDDFLGPAAGNEPPFFARVADAYLDSVKRIAEPARAVQAEIAHVARLRNERFEAARAGIRMRAADLLLSDVALDSAAAVDMSAASPQLAQAIPAGVATVYLHDSQGRVAAGTKAVDMPPGSNPAELKYPLAAAGMANRGPLMQASWLYRGNEISTSFLLRPPGGMTVDVEPFRYGPPQVIVRGQGRKRASIMLILDCSHSMAELTRSEGPNDAQRVSRFSVAQNALSQMLEQLAQANARVGVRFFGHRIGWNTKQPNQLLPQPGYSGHIPEDLLPSMDVELVLPLGRFDEGIAQSVAEKLKQTKPWGESPLYLALIESLGDFADEPADSEKSVIVIADGINYQFNAPEPKTRDEVLQAYRGRNVKINIVGFEIPEQEAAEARRDFGLLASETGGSYASAANATTLIKSLESMLGPQDFRVLDGQQHLVGEARLGLPVVVTPPPVGMRPYSVSLDRLSAPVELAGGEHAELFPSRDGSRLESARFEIGEPRYVPVNGPEDEASGYLLGVHRALLADHAAQIPLSIVKADHSFAARAAEMWVEVRVPQSAPDKAGQLAVFYDANYLPGTSAPVVNCTAGHWPPGAKTAIVSAWFKRQPTAPARVISFGDLLVRRSEAEPIAPLDGVPGVSVQLRLDRETGSTDAYRLAVVERHDVHSPTLAALKVQTFPAAERIVHRFDSTNRLVTHQFFFRGVSKDDLTSYELRLTRASDAKSGAYIAEPTEVDVLVASDLIRLSAPRNPR